MTLKLHRASFVFCLLAYAACASNAQTYGMEVSQSTYTGLYDSSGASSLSTTNVVKAGFTMNYVGTGSFSSPNWTMNYDSVSGVMQTKIRITYSNTGWQTAPNSAVVGIQGTNYLSVTTLSTHAIAMNLTDSFLAPTTSILSGTYGTKGTTFTYDTTYSHVNPMLFQVNLGTVDSGDGTGKTAIYTYNSTVLVPNPWLTFPQYDYTYNSSTYAETFMPVIWLFVKPGSAGIGYTNGVGYPFSTP